jgi:hypothetical protein
VTPYYNCLIRLDAQTGNIDQPALDLTAVGGNTDQLIPSSPINLTMTGSNAAGNLNVYMTIGALDETSGTRLGYSTGYVYNINVTPTSGALGSSSVNWKTSALQGITLSQFTEAVYTDSSGNPHNTTVWTGANYGPYFFGY